MRAQDQSTQVPNTAGQSALMRLGWMMAGPLMVLIATFSILSKPSWTFGGHDGLLLLGVSLATVCRYLDIKRYNGQTANGETATMTNFTRYAISLSVIAAALWAAAQSTHV